MLVDPNSELIKQLTRIAEAASAPHTSPWAEWLKTIGSFIAGLATAYISDLIRTRSSENSEQTKMRRIVYCELASCFLSLNSAVGAETTLRGVRYKVFKDLCPFDGEAYMKNNPAVFYQLSEGQILTAMYYWFHRVDGGGIENPRTYGLSEMKSPLGFFSDRYREYPIIKKNFKKILPKSDFAIIDHTVKRYKHGATIEELVDAGVMRIAADPAPEHDAPHS